MGIEQGSCCMPFSSNHTKSNVTVKPFHRKQNKRLTTDLFIGTTQGSCSQTLATETTQIQCRTQLNLSSKKPNERLAVDLSNQKAQQRCSRPFCRQQNKKFAAAFFIPANIHPVQNRPQSPHSGGWSHPFPSKTKQETYISKYVRPLTSIQREIALEALVEKNGRYA